MENEEVLSEPVEEQRLVPKVCLGGGYWPGGQKRPTRGSASPGKT